MERASEAAQSARNAAGEQSSEAENTMRTRQAKLMPDKTNQQRSDCDL